MHTVVKRTVPGVLAGLLLFTGAAGGQEIYKWVAADGATHYSEVPPATELASVEVLEMTVVTSAQPVSRSYQSVLDVANSIEASRLERERLRLEERKLRLQQAQVRRQAAARDDIDSGDQVVGYYYRPDFRHDRKPPYGGGRHSRPGHRPHPGEERSDLRARVYTRQK